MASTSVDGLVSGLDTSTIISQLMQIEAQGQTRLKSKVSTEQAGVTAYQAINAALKTLVDKARSLDATADWNVVRATSSSTGVAASATAGAAPGSFTFDVVSVAAAHTVLYGTAVAPADVVAGASVDVTVGGTTTTLATGGGTLQEVVDAINGSTGLGVRAGTIRVADGSYRLQLSATSTGAAGQFTVAGLTAALGSPAVTTTGADATVAFGPAAGDVVSSSSNTFTDIVPGLTFTVSKPETGVRVTVARDDAAVTASVKAMVDAARAALSEIAKDTAYDAATRKGGPLLGQLLPSRIQADLRTAVLPPSGDPLSAVGIQLDSAGTIVLDETKLAEALRADGAHVTDLVSGFAQRLVATAEPVSAAGGEIASVIDGRQALIRGLTSQIEQWDARLALRRGSLQRQFAALETTLGQLQSQSSWLAGQLSSLGSAS